MGANVSIPNINLRFDVDEMETEYKRKARKKMVLTKSTFRLRFRIPFLKWSTMLYVTRPLDVWTMGISNLTLDGRFVPFFDFDKTFLYRVRQELKMLQRKYKLGTLIVLSSSVQYDNQHKEYGNYHAIGVSRLSSLREHMEMLEESSVDSHFTNISSSFNGKYWVLRILPKIDKHGREVVGRPVMRWVLPSKTDRKISTGHLKFLNTYYNFPEVNGNRHDGYDWIKLVKYPSTYGTWKSDILPESKVLLSKMLKHFNKGDKYANDGAGS